MNFILQNRAFFGVLGLIAFLGIVGFEEDSESAVAGVPAPAERPPLRVKQGRYFQFALPEGWSYNETMSGVEMIAPDKVTGATFSLLMGGFGQTTPKQYLNMVLGSLGLPDVKYLSVRNLPDAPGPMGFAWKVIEAELTFTYQGTKVRAHVTCGVVQGMGQYCAVTRGYQAPVKQWEKEKYFLPRIEQSVVITNPRQVAGLDRVDLPRNVPHDYIYGQYNQAWQARQASADRMSQAQMEATLGYERMKDPNTGQLYDMPMEYYDPTRGGYVNPNDPTELLIKAAVGE